MSAPRVLLMRLSCRMSARGREYLAGFLGAARVVAFKAKEPDRYGNEQWEVFVAEPEPKPAADAPPADHRPPLPTRGQRVWDRARATDRARDAQQSFHDDTDAAVADLEGREP